MKYTYEKIVRESATGTDIIIKRTDENGNESWVPTDLANSDYQAYLEHEAKTK